MATRRGFLGLSGIATFLLTGFAVSARSLSGSTQVAVPQVPSGYDKNRVRELVEAIDKLTANASAEEVLTVLTLVKAKKRTMSAEYAELEAKLKKSRETLEASKLEFNKARYIELLKKIRNS